MKPVQKELMVLTVHSPVCVVRIPLKHVTHRMVCAPVSLVGQVRSAMRLAHREHTDQVWRHFVIYLHYCIIHDHLITS